VFAGCVRFGFAAIYGQGLPCWTSDRRRTSSSGEAAKTTATVTGAVARAASEATSATAGIGTQIAAAITSVGIDAGKVFAGVFGLLAPVMGPAAASEAQTFAAGMTRLATRVWEIPQHHAGVVASRRNGSAAAVRGRAPQFDLGRRVDRQRAGRTVYRVCAQCQRVQSCRHAGDAKRDYPAARSDCSSIKASIRRPRRSFWLRTSRKRAFCFRFNALSLPIRACMRGRPMAFRRHDQRFRRGLQFKPPIMCRRRHVMTEAVA
jgi:hypothetical protein